jgi:hypothetical protein
MASPGWIFRDYSKPDVVVDVLNDYTYISGSACPDDYYTPDQLVSRQHGFYEAHKTGEFTKKLARGDFIPQRAYTRLDSFEKRPPGTYGGTYTSPSKSYTYSKAPRRGVTGASIYLSDVHVAIDELTKSFDFNSVLQTAIANASPDLDVLTLLAEAHQTVGLILGARKRAKKLILQALRGGKHTAKAAADAWLEWRYGWRILLYDMAAISDFVETPFREIRTGRANVTFADIKSSTSHFSGYYVTHDTLNEVNRKLSVNATCAVLVEANTLNAFASFAVTAWELVPYSFVADWFVSIGDVLKAWSVLQGAKQVTLTRGEYYEETGKSQVVNVTAGTGTYASNPHASGTSYSGCSFKRRTPVPRGSVSLAPQIRVNLSSKRILDAAALLSKRIF